MYLLTCHHLILHQNTKQQLWQLAKPIDQPSTMLSIIYGKLGKTIAMPDAPFKLANTTDKELAEQITLIDFRLYSEVRFTELLGQAWNKDKKRHQAPNLMQNINFLNKVSNWVSYQILIQEDDQKRKKVVKKFLKILAVSTL